MNLNKIKFLLYNFYRSKLEGKLFFIDLDKHHKISYKKWVEDEEEDCYLSKMLKSNKPFFFARCGAVELSTISDYLCIKHGLQSDYSDFVYSSIKTNAGVFPVSKNTLNHFSEIYLNSLANITDFAVWMNKPFQQFITNNYAKAERVFDAKLTYSFNYNYPKYLENKKVLVVSSFAKTIEKQYTNRKTYKINLDILTNFTLITYKPVVSNGDEKTDFKNWFDALETMYNDIKDIDYDVVILSCGAYGLPLGSLLYKYKKRQILHLGGSVQVLFGIRGKYYDALEEVKKRINDRWVYPSKEETTKGFEKIENGSYFKP